MDPSKKYRISAWAKSGYQTPWSGSVTGSLRYYDPSTIQYVGFILYDIDKLEISTPMVMRYGNAADTYLISALTPGDGAMKIQSSANWYTESLVYNRRFVWYGYTNAQGYTYPPFTYTRNTSRTYELDTSQGTWQSGSTIFSSPSGSLVILRSPWTGPLLPSGSAVRNASDGATYKYTLIPGLTVPSVWTKYEGSIYGTSGGTSSSYVDVNNFNLFHLGTAFARMVFLKNYTGTGDNRIAFSNIWMSEKSITNLEPITQSLNATNSYTSNFSTQSLFATQSISASYVSGSNSTISNLTSSTIFVQAINFNSGTIPAWDEGAMYYDTASSTLAYYNDNSQMTVNLGQETIVKVFNSSSNIIANGSPVYLSGSFATTPQAWLAIADGTGQKADVAGVTTTTIPIKGYGYVTSYGEVNGLSLNFPTGSYLWLSSTTSGSYQLTSPPGSLEKVQVGILINSGSGTSMLMVDVDQNVFSAYTASIALTSSLLQGVLTASSPPLFTPGMMFYNSASYCWSYYNETGSVNLGRESQYRCYNSSSGPLFNGMPVYISASTNGYPNIWAAIADGTWTKSNVAGVCTMDIGVATYGYITRLGRVDSIIRGLGGIASGSLLYLSPTASGSLTITPPTGLTESVVIGSVISSGSTGAIALIDIAKTANTAQTASWAFNAISASWALVGQAITQSIQTSASWASSSYTASNGTFASAEWAWIGNALTTNFARNITVTRIGVGLYGFKFTTVPANGFYMPLFCGSTASIANLQAPTASSAAPFNKIAASFSMSISSTSAIARSDLVSGSIVVFTM